MTEVEEALKAAGLDINQWAESEAHMARSPLVQGQERILVRLLELLEIQLAQDQASLVKLHEQMARLKHGGGT